MMTTTVTTATMPFLVYPYGMEPQYDEQPSNNAFYRIGYSGNVEEVHDTPVGRFVLPLLSEMDKKVGARVHGQFEPRVPLPSRRLLLEVVDVFKEHSDEPIVAYVIWNLDQYEVVWGTEDDWGYFLVPSPVPIFHSPLQP